MDITIIILILLIILFGGLEIKMGFISDFFKNGFKKN